jgi:hypothetical protein
MTPMHEALQLEREWRDPTLIARPPVPDVNDALRTQQRREAQLQQVFSQGLIFGALMGVGLTIILSIALRALFA